MTAISSMLQASMSFSLLAALVWTLGAPFHYHLLMPWTHWPSWETIPNFVVWLSTSLTLPALKQTPMCQSLRLTFAVVWIFACSLYISNVWLYLLSCRWSFVCSPSFGTSRYAGWWRLAMFRPTSWLGQKCRSKVIARFVVPVIFFTCKNNAYL